MTMAIPLIYSLRSIAVRKGSSAMAVGGIALVVVVFVALLSLAAGFQRVVATSGSPGNVIILRKGADAELQSQVLRETARVISELPMVAEEDGQKLVVFESVIILARPKRGGGETNVTIRGTPPHARAVHAEVRLTQGRWFTPGSNEAVIGVGLARRLRDVGLGQTMAVGRNIWHIVGMFEAGGSCAGIRTLDGRRPAAKHVSPRRRFPVGAVPRRGRRARGGRTAQRADRDATCACAPCRP